MHTSRLPDTLIVRGSRPQVQPRGLAAPASSGLLAAPAAPAAAAQAGRRSTLCYRFHTSCTTATSMLPQLLRLLTPAAAPPDEAKQRLYDRRGGDTRMTLSPRTKRNGMTRFCV
jgi:hypothetical protein